MNLAALSRKLLRPPAPRPRRAILPPAIEPLEARIAPATLVNPTTVTFQDKNGDAVTVTISKPLFTTASVAKVFTFDTGSVNGSNASEQQLEMMDITKLGQAARGMDISITAVPVSGSPGVVNVGYINASGIDLGNVTVGGDLGRIAAGDLAFSTQGLHSLTVESLGAQGLATQAAGGNLNTLIAGPVGSITVNGDIDGASIGIGGGVKGSLGSLTVTGSIDGGMAAFAGSVRTQGGIANVLVEGSILGGAGADSGLIGTAGGLGTVLIDGTLTGGAGQFSGAILSTKSISSITVEGDLAGGSGLDSGQIGTAANLGTATIGGAVLGGIGGVSGAILATGNITTAAITYGLVGGTGPGSGQVGAGGNIGTVTAGGSMTADALIHAHGSIGLVSIGNSAGLAIPGIQPLDSSYNPAILNSSIIADTGSIGSIVANAINAYAICNSTITAGGNIGSIQAADTQAPPEGGNVSTTAIVNSGFDAGGNIGNITSDGITGSVFIAGIDLGAAFNVASAGGFGNGYFGFGSSKSGVAAHIGNISAPFIEQSTFLAGVHGAGPDGTFGTKDDLVPAGSSIGTVNSAGGINTVFMESGDIGATTSGEIVATTYIATDTAVSAGGIGPIVVNSDAPTSLLAIPGPGLRGLTPLLSSDTSHGIYNSTFISNAGIGAINVTFGGVRGSGENAGISNTTFQAGHALGTITVTDSASGAGGANYGIINSTFNAGLNGYGGAGDISVTLTDAGPDGNSAAIANCQFDASVCACMSASMGSISAENADTSPTAAGIVDSVFRVHGNMGDISATMDSGSPTAPGIEGTIFSAFGSIGAINVYGAVTGDTNGPSRFLAGYDIGADMTFGNEDLSATSLALNAAQSVGDVTVTGYFEGSDIAASINPGAGYVFGSSANTNVGAGGAIGLVNIGTNVAIEGNPFTGDHATDHAIEAANFTLAEGDVPTVAAFGVTANIPVVLYVDGASNDVRITNLAQADT